MKVVTYHLEVLCQGWCEMDVFWVTCHIHTYIHTKMFHASTHLMNGSLVFFDCGTNTKFGCPDWLLTARV